MQNIISRVADMQLCSDVWLGYAHNTHIPNGMQHLAAPKNQRYHV
jgi:hypothetical protein